MRFKNYWGRVAVLAAAVSLCGSVSAQFGAGSQGTTVNPDNSVTFNLSAPNAKSVFVDAQFSGRQAMTKDARGNWSVTLTPPAIDIYPYCFIVDGVQVMDPSNPEWFPNEKFKNSLLDMRGADVPQEAMNVPHGNVDYVFYPSKTMGIDMPAVIYTPPFYDKNNKKKYPVYYLISGTTDSEEVFFKVGKVNYILDNLIAQGKAKEMIVVLPYGNPSLYLQYNNVKGGGMANFNADFLNDLMPYVESNYRTINTPDGRAVGGFSRGGNQGLGLGLSNLDRFSYLCSYSSFTGAAPRSVYENADETNGKIHMFWLGVGLDDFLYDNAKDYVNSLNEYGIKHIELYTDGKFGHTWMNARYFLNETLPLLFQKKDPEIPAEPIYRTFPDGKEKKADEPKQPQRLDMASMARMFPQGVKSPEYNADGTVTFRFESANAEKVELDLQEHPRTEMTKNARGVWEATVTPKAPDLYPYCFIMDGLQVADPNNMYIFPNEGFKNSLVDIRAAEPTMQDMQAVPHGKVTYCTYHSNNLGFERPMCIYTPAGYNAADKKTKYPVLYLIHGMTDTYETWFKVGRMNFILDNLIAQGLCEKMIVVMPYANPAIEMAKQGQSGYNLMDPSVNTKEILEEIIPYIESNYRVKTDADSRAIAGFSLGGRQTLATGINNPDKFHYVCAFAPAFYEESWFENVDKINSELKLMWLGCGKSDFLHNTATGLEKLMNDKGVKHEVHYSDGGHTWMNCRDYLEIIAKKLFK